MTDLAELMRLADMANEAIEKSERSSKMEYTKGEWKAQVPDFSTDFVFRVKAENDYFSEVVTQVKGYTYEEALANAQLISAAPDLYEALLAIVNSGPLSKNNFSNALEALAKAEGAK